MADPKVALAAIGIYHPTRIGPPSTIKAIQEDTIKVTFDASKASAKLARLNSLKKTSSPLVLATSKTGRLDIDGLVEATQGDLKILENPSRGRTLTNKVSGTSTVSSLVASRKSSLAMANERLKNSLNSSLTGDLARKPSSQLAATKLSGFGKLDGKVGTQRKKSQRESERYPHGFRYHSNGDERISGSVSSSTVRSTMSSATSMLEDTIMSVAELCRMRAQCMATLPRARAVPLTKVKHILKPTGAKSMKEKKMSRNLSTSGLCSSPCGEDKVAQHKKNSTSEGDNMYKQTIMRHIRDMASDNVCGCGLCKVQPVPSSNNTALMNSGSRITNSPVGSGYGHTPKRSTSPGEGSSRNTHDSSGIAGCSSPEQIRGSGFEDDAGPGDCFSAGNSSFNMRFGVPVKTMAQRKHILDWQHQRELEEVYKNDVQIESYLHTASKLRSNKSPPPRSSRIANLHNMPYGLESP